MTCQEIRDMYNTEEYTKEWNDLLDQVQKLLVTKTPIKKVKRNQQKFTNMCKDFIKTEQEQYYFHLQLENKYQCLKGTTKSCIKITYEPRKWLLMNMVNEVTDKTRDYQIEELATILNMSSEDLITKVNSDIFKDSCKRFLNTMVTFVITGQQIRYKNILSELISTEKEEKYFNQKLLEMYDVMALSYQMDKLSC